MFSKLCTLANALYYELRYELTTDVVRKEIFRVLMSYYQAKLALILRAQ